MENIKIVTDQLPIPDLNDTFRIEVTIPASHFIPDDILSHQIHSIYDSNIIKHHFFNEGQLTNYQITKICKYSTEIFRSESNLLRIDVKSVIIGDIHGQYYDLLNILDNFNLEKDTLVFLGDYVDRGVFSTEVYIYLLCLKIQYPSRIFLLRGNHESEKMTSYFTFRQECILKYDINIYRQFVESFKHLPLAAVVKEAFCCHGGISPHMKSVEEINSLNRIEEVPFSGLFCDLLWADPNPKFESKRDYARNNQRNCSYFYNNNAVKQFLEANGLKTIIRGHEVQQLGYKSISHKKSTVITIFSAPNYCDVYGNLGAYIIYDKDITIVKFRSVDHPFYLPNHSDGINWSFPFVSEKICEFYKDIINIIGKEDSSVKKFIKSMALMRNDRECISEMDEESTELPCCTLKNIEPQVDFDDAKSSDSNNEKVKVGDDIIEERSSSCTNEVTRQLVCGEIKSTIDNSTVAVDNDKGVLEVIINNSKKEKKKKDTNK